MKKLTPALAFAALIAAAFAPLAGSSEKGQAMRLGPPPSASILLAQAGSKDITCEVDGRRVPVGATYCRKSKLMLCGGSGTWTDTGNPC